jgi:hypothetical protein
LQKHIATKLQIKKNEKKMKNLTSTKSLFLKTIDNNINDLEQEKNEKEILLTNLLKSIYIIEILIFGILLLFPSFAIISVLLSTIAIYMFININIILSNITNIKAILKRLEKSKKLIEKVKYED